MKTPSRFRFAGKERTGHLQPKGYKMIGLPDYDLIAEVCDKAHDEMLVRGKTVGGMTDDGGRVCLISAMYVGRGFDYRHHFFLYPLQSCWVQQRDPAVNIAALAIARRYDLWDDPESIFTLSDDHDIDFTLDVLRDTAKAARNGEL